MNTQERKAKILEATQGQFMTVADISRAAFGNAGHARRCREVILAMVREGTMEAGEKTLLPNQLEVATYRAVPGAGMSERGGDVFHGRAPSVFEWRGNFSLRS